MKINKFLSIFVLILTFFVGASFHKYKIFPFGLGLFSLSTQIIEKKPKLNQENDKLNSTNKDLDYKIFKDIVFTNNTYEVNFDLIKVPIEQYNDNIRLGGYLEKINKSEILFLSPCGEYHILNLDNYKFQKKIYKLDKKINEKFDLFCKDNAGIKDILKFNDEYYISTNLIDNSGKKYIGIVRYSLINNQLIFKDLFFKTNGYPSAASLQSGGRIVAFKDHLLFSIGDFGNINKVQQDDTFLGKIVKIDPYTKKYQIYSKGHRNPQGLFYDISNDIIIVTEHGPMGGDEINYVRENENYGWPIDSYGTTYSGARKCYDLFFNDDKSNNKKNLPKYLIKNQYNFKDSEDICINWGKHENFTKPERVFLASLGIQQIIKLKLYGKEIYLLGSLKNNTIYHYEQLGNEKQINPFLQFGRFRDMINLTSNTFITVTDEEEILKIKKIKKIDEKKLLN
jgi:aldose sugar dehydrogenase